MLRYNEKMCTAPEYVYLKIITCLSLTIIFNFHFQNFHINVISNALVGKEMLYYGDSKLFARI